MAKEHGVDYLEFQSTLPQGERLSLFCVSVPFNAFQSTLPQGERLKKTAGSGSATLISIHAPTRGATKLLQCFVHLNAISIHAPTRGATINASTLNMWCNDFNPRSHKGSDVAIPSKEDVLNISIHAPTRGATRINFLIAALMSISIHAPTRGATTMLSEMILSTTFQSTLPQGERHEQLDDTSKATLISIHAPTRGATSIFTLSCSSIRISIHAPTRGATRRARDKHHTFPHFNPRSHKGSDWKNLQLKRLDQKFQSTLPQGERQGQTFRLVLTS